MIIFLSFLLTFVIIFFILIPIVLNIFKESLWEQIERRMKERDDYLQMKANMKQKGRK